MTTPSISETKTWLIVGASRGIGRELTQQLVNRGDKVFATVRGNVGKQDVPHVVYLKCDVTEEGSIEVRVAMPPLCIPDR